MWVDIELTAELMTDHGIGFVVLSEFNDFDFLLCCKNYFSRKLVLHVKCNAKTWKGCLKGVALKAVFTILTLFLEHNLTSYLPFCLFCSLNSIYTTFLRKWTYIASGSTHVKQSLEELYPSPYHIATEPQINHGMCKHYSMWKGTGPAWEANTTAIVELCGCIGGIRRIGNRKENVVACCMIGYSY